MSGMRGRRTLVVGSVLAAAAVIAGVGGAWLRMGMHEWVTAPPTALEIRQMFPEFVLKDAALEGVQADRDTSLYRFRHPRVAPDALRTLEQQAVAVGWVELPELRKPGKVVLSRVRHRREHQATIAYADGELQVTLWPSP